MRPFCLSCAGCLAIVLLASCSNQQEKTSKATLKYWNDIVTMNRYELEICKRAKTRKAIADSYRRSGDEIARLPTLDVDQELVQLMHSYSKAFLDLSYVFGRVAEREDSLIDLALTSLLAPSAIKQDNEELQRCKLRMREHFDASVRLRAALTARYKVEFQPLE